MIRASVAVLLLAVAPSVTTAAPEDIRIVEPGILTGDRYEVVGRLWVDSWRSAFQVPTHDDRAAAVAELRAEAERRGANALTNVTCLVDGKPLLSSPHFCYALAIRVK